MSNWEKEFEKFWQEQQEKKAAAQAAAPDLNDVFGEYGEWTSCEHKELLPGRGQDVILLFRDTFHKHKDWPRIAVSPAWRCNVEEEKTPYGQWALTGRLYSIFPGVIDIEDGIAWMALPNPLKGED